MVGVHHIAAEIICLHSHINNKAPDASCTESFVLSYFTIEETGFHTLHSYEECLGSTKLEEHIQTDRNMILIIGYIEIYDSLILAILILHIGKAQATVFHTIICLDGNLTIKLYLSWSAVLSISNREFYGITLLPVGRIETAGTQEDVHHVKNTIIVGGILPYMLAIMLLTVLLEMTPTARIAVEYLIYRIALALVSSLRKYIGARSVPL